MIDNPSALPEMHDIVTPPAASWWPLAPGWYLLAVLVVTLLALTLVLIVRRHRRRRIRNAALKQLQQQPPASLPAVTLLLKQAMLGYFPATRVAALSGSDWWQFLVQQLPRRRRAEATAWLTPVQQQNFQDPASGSEAYQDAVDSYRRFARYWLRSALPPQKGAGHD